MKTNKILLMVITATFFFSCSSNKVDLTGDFVKVESKSAEYGIYTFDFNTTLNIEDNGENYLITEGKGNKLPASLEKGILKINDDCSILIDKTENVLVRTCVTGGTSVSEDFWPKQKVDEYLNKPKGEIAYNEYVNSLVFDLYNDDYKVPTIDDLQLGDYERENFLPDSTLKKNAYYPIMAFGDFNGDGKMPDIATIIKNEKSDNIHSYNASKLVVFHAGKPKPIEIREMFCNWISAENNRKLDSYWEKDVVKKKSDGIVSVCLEKSAKVFYWSGYKYDEYWVSD